MRTTPRRSIVIIYKSRFVFLWTSSFVVYNHDDLTCFLLSNCNFTFADFITPVKYITNFCVHPKIGTYQFMIFKLYLEMQISCVVC